MPVPGLHWLLRMKRWQQNPPSVSRVVLVLGVVALCVVIVAVEHWVGWPAWMSAERVPRMRVE